MTTLDRRSFVVGTIAIVPLAALGCDDALENRRKAITGMADAVVDGSLYVGTAIHFAKSGYCVDCGHFRPIRGGLIWYDRFCGRTERRQVRHPVTGKMVYAGGSNAFGDVTYGDKKYPYARDINGDGQCTNFKAKS